jgi:hypothetical protein
VSGLGFHTQPSISGCIPATLASRVARRSAARKY